MTRNDQGDDGKDPTATSDSTEDQLWRTAGEVAERAGDTAGRQASTGMTRAGEMLDRVAEAVRRTGDDLRGEQPQVADYAALAAGQVERAAVFLREKDASDLVDELDRFARRQPVVVIGAAFAAGFLATRFLRTSAPGDGVGRGWEGPDAYGRVGYAGRGYGVEPAGGAVRDAGA